VSASGWRQAAAAATDLLIVAWAAPRRKTGPRRAAVDMLLASGARPYFLSYTRAWIWFFKPEVYALHRHVMLMPGGNLVSPPHGDCPTVEDACESLVRWITRLTPAQRAYLKSGWARIGELNQTL
jgi:hypothetical protein